MAVYNPVIQTERTLEGGELPTMSEDAPLGDNLTEYHKIHKAIESEFALSQPDSPEAMAKAKLTELLNTATRTLETLLISAESESVQMQGIKLVFEYALGKPTGIGTEDELSKLVQSLTKT